jgi:hypothetical protein
MELVMFMLLPLNGLPEISLENTVNVSPHNSIYFAQVILRPWAEYVQAILINYNISSSIKVPYCVKGTPRSLNACYRAHIEVLETRKIREA